MATATRKVVARKAPALKRIVAKSAKAAPAPESPPAKPAKSKHVRGKFVMPKSDYKLIDKLKTTGKRAGIKVKKSELFRLGLRGLQKSTPAELRDLILDLRLPPKNRGK